MSKRRVGLHEIAYESLAAAERRRGHPPREMRSGNSKGPVRMWVCNEIWCESISYTYVEPHTPPVCFGGMKFSFLTNDTFDVRVHQPWARR